MRSFRNRVKDKVRKGGKKNRDKDKPDNIAAKAKEGPRERK